MASLKKVILITNIPNPYRIPLFNELNRQLEERNTKLFVIFGSLTYKRRMWKVEMSECQFDHLVLDSTKIELGSTEKTIFTYPKLIKAIKRINPDVIITNGFSLATTKVWMHRFFRQIPHIIWSGSVQNERKKESFFRTLHRKILVKKTNGFIAYGTKAKAYLHKLGAPIRNIHIAVNTVDTEYFRQKTSELRQQEPKKDDQVHLLYIGHLSPRKDVLSLLKVIRSLSTIRKDIILDIVGEGSDRELLQNYVKENDLWKFVNFHGFKQKMEMPKYLALSSCFLFQTSFDIWGLVLVEAMAAGLPCLASIHAGATHDLIQEGVTGYKVDFSNIKEVVKKITTILDDTNLADKVGGNGQKFIVNNVNLSISANGMVQSIMPLLN